MKFMSPRRTSALILAGSIAALVALAPPARATSGPGLDTESPTAQWSTTSN